MKKISTITVFLVLMIALFTGNAQAQSANALKFDPSLAVGDNSRLNYVGINTPFTAYQKEITVEFWMYAPNANLPFGSVMGQATSNTPTTEVWLMHPNTNGTMTFFVNDGGSTLRSATINIIAGSWHHYAGVASATSTKFYVDGVLMSTGAGISSTILSNPASVIHIGKDVRYATRYVTNNDPFNRYATMTMDEVRIWSRALCVEEINNNKNCELFNPTGQNKLESYYNFNQGIAGGNNATVTTLNDLSGNNRNGTLNNFSLNGANSNWVTSGSTNTGTCAPFVTGPITGNTSICAGTGTTLSQSISGGSWSSSNTAVATINATTGVVNGLSAGTTTITYSSACAVTTATLTVNALPIISATSNSPVCKGFTLNLSANGGVSYVWAGPNGFTSNEQNPSISNVIGAAAGTYSVKGTGANGCKNDATVAVTVNTLDSDGDGIPDACDEDADNDGIPNVLECNKSNFFWSNVPAVSGNTATGTINGISYTYTSSSPVSTTPSMFGNNNFPVSYGVPNTTCIKNTAVTNNTISFASPMTNPVLVFASIGQGGLKVPISFSAPIEVVWSQSVTQNSSTKITGEEGYAIIRLMGTFSSINFNYETAENYCNFAFGADFMSCGDTDGDGIPDYLDTDSDNDGCPDAIEGSMHFSMSQTSGGRLIGGVDSHGIPLLAGTGQGIGTSQNYVINCFCQPGLDKTNPITIAKDITVNLDASGIATITAVQVDNGSSDNCGIANKVVSKTSFNCSNLGANTVTLTITDNQGNVSTATAIVTVVDNQVPNVLTQNVTVYLDNNGQANVTAAQVNNGSSDNCGIATMTVSPSSFTCVDKTAAVTTNTQTIISDNTWAESTTTYSTGNYCTSGIWNGVSSPLPSLVSYSIVPTINAYSVTPIPGTQGIYGLNGVRFFRKTFNLSSLSGIKATLLAAMDNGVQIFINGVAVAFQGNMNSDGYTFNGLNPDRVILNSTGANVNGGVGYHSFDNTTNASAGSLFVVGTNEIVLALANCDDRDRGAISFKAIIENNVGGPGTVVLTVTDASGNSTSANAQVTVVDAIKPVINCPAIMEVFATSAAGAVVTYDAPIATDNCSVASVVMTGGIASGSIFPIGITTVTYHATDGSGNFADCSFTVTVKGLPPVINCPSNITVDATAGQCGANVSFAATETTGIPASTITYSVASGSFFSVGSKTVTATAANAVGSSSCTFTVTVTDTQFPVLVGVPADATVECDAVPAAATVTATDNCTTSVPTFTETRTNGNCANNYTLTRTWSTTDASGNTTTATQVITVQDTKAPVLTVPADISVSNDNNVCGATVTFAATATDNCSTPTITYSQNPGTVFAIGKTVVTVTAKDACGNTTLNTFTVKVTDTQFPVLVGVPADATVECDAVPAAATVTATDNCTTSVPAFTETRTNGNCANNYTLTRTWSTTDASGNKSTQSQVITVQDTKAPLLSNAPDNITVECNAVPTAAILTATDNCSTPTVVYTQTSTQNANANTAGYYNYTLTRTWTATDACGNASSKTQVITVQDKTKPVVVTCPSSVTQCNDLAGNIRSFTFVATDNCGPTTATYSITAPNGSVVNGTGNTITTGFAIGTTTVNWTVKDVSGNTSTCSNTVVVRQLPDYTISSVPTNNTNTYTGGNNSNLYLGYGAQSTKLQINHNAVAGNELLTYTYSWSGSLNGTSMLSSTTSAAPVFTPTTAGYFTFTVVVTNNLGCSTTRTINICVTDIRVAGTNGSKVYVCHLPPGNPGNPQTLSISVNAVPAHLGNHTGDRLGSCNQVPCGAVVAAAASIGNTAIVAKTEADATTAEELKVTVMPNPSTTYFTLKLESKYETHVNMRVMDATGRVVDAKSKIGANSTIQIGHNYSNGTYYAEMTQEARRKVVQLIKEK